MLIVALAIGLALGIQAFVVKPYQIPSESMVPTLEKQQRVLVNRLVYHFSDPDINDIIVFHPPKGAQCAVRHKSQQPCPDGGDEMDEDNFIKRIVAGPGDVIYIEDGVPVVNGEKASEDFIRPCGPHPSVSCNLRDAITIPPDHYFMMGDNRGSSDDSRVWGPIPRDWIIGQAFFTYWPPSRVGLL